VIRRQLRIYPDQTFDSVQVRKSVDRLKAQSGLYSDVRISPVNVGNDTASALVDVLEGQSGKISVGAGLSSNSGLIGQLSLEQKNFDWTAWPTSWEELISGKAFKGAGQSMLIQLEPGTELQRYRMRFEEPSLYDTIYSFANDLYYFTRERESYDEKRIGDVITLGRRFGDVWSASVSLRAEQVTIEQVEDVNNDGVSQSGYFLLNNAGKVYGPFSDSAQQILDEVGDHFIVSIKPAIVRDTTDSRVFPSDGTRFTFSWEQYGGDLSMSKIVSRFDWYYTLNTDLFDRKTVFVMRNEVGVIFGDSVFYERFYGGGTGSLRGFRFRGVGPREGGLKDPVGGDFSWVTTMEVNFPIYENMIRGVFFVDVGTVEKDITISTIRADVGFGARVKLNFFGELPLALDFAFPISKANGDETQFLSFSLGIPY
jgi:outer membrane protein insertion porin family